MAYLLDTNAFIEAKKRWYGFDICPGYWDWIDTAHSAGEVESLEAVRDELLAGNDDLSDWARARPGGFFVRLDDATLEAMSRLAEWVRAQQYKPAAVTTFLESADYRLIAYAMTHGHTVVTLELPSDARKRVKIPEPCVAFGVEYITPFVMLRRSGARLICDPR
jgi:hypothetical protein